MSGRGFSLVEALMALSLVLVITVLLFPLVSPAHSTFASEPESADLQQRTRVAADILFRDVLAAVPPLIPHRRGTVRPDPPGAFRGDTLSLTLSTAAGPPVQRTYYLKPASGLSPPQLMRYNGAASDVPAVDHVVGLAFTYLEQGMGGLQPIDPARLVDGPWVPDAMAAARFDADLLQVRAVRATIRIEAAAASLRGASPLLFARPGTARRRWLPDQVIEIEAAPRSRAAAPPL
jgi:hypothetical protein